MLFTQQNSKTQVIQTILSSKREDMKLNGAQKMILDIVRNLLNITTDLPSKIFFAQILGRVTDFKYRMMDRTF